MAESEETKRHLHKILDTTYREPEEFANHFAKAASPSECGNTTPLEPIQSQALQAPMAALIRPQLRGQTTNQEGDANSNARNVG